MEDSYTNIYFTTEALQKMLAVHGKTISKVVILLWQNSIDPNNTVEIIDSLQLRFTDNTRITIGCNENSDGLDILDFNLEETKKHLLEEFEGKIKMFALDAGKTKMWVDVEGKVLNSIQVTKDHGNYRADSVMLDFGGEERRTVSISPSDGLIIDYYEEV